MALLKTIELPAGLTVPNTYIRIEEVNGNKESLVMQVVYYVSQETAESNKPCLKWDNHYFVPSVDEGAENFIKQGYEHLKTMPEFADALDC